MLQRRVNGPHVKAHGKHIASTTGGFPHIDGEGHEEGRGGRVEQGSLVPKLLWRFSSLHCHPEPPLTPPVLPLSSPSLPSSTTSQAFRLSFVRPPLHQPKPLTYWPLTPPPGLSVLFYLFFSSRSTHLPVPSPHIFSKLQRFPET